MLFVIRDDDASYFTRPEELEAAYGDLWARAPVSLAVIPFDVPTFHRGHPAQFRQEGAGVSLEENGELVRFLSELIQSGRAEAMLHGYNHLYKQTDSAPFNPHSWIPEFVHTGEKEQKLRRGRALLEQVLGAPVRVFVPPSNAISRDGLRALGAVGLDQACLSDIRELAAAHPWNVVAAAAARLSRRFPYGVRRYARHRELWCHPLTPSCDWARLCARLRECAARDGVFALATHYWEQEAENVSSGAPLRELLRDLVQRGKALEARFVLMSEAFGR